MKHIPNAYAEGAPATPSPPPDIYDEVAYAYDGSLEGLLSAVFAAYERHERPTDVAPEERLQPRLGQRVALIPTDQDRALRVMSTLRRQCGRAAALAVTRAACSDEPDAGTAVYRFVRYAIDEQKHRACEPLPQARLLRRPRPAWGRAPSSGVAPSRTSPTRQ